MAIFAVGTFICFMRAIKRRNQAVKEKNSNFQSDNKQISRLSSIKENDRFRAKIPRMQRRPNVFFIGKVKQQFNLIQIV